jgi:polyisoprenoid-binding protein YceI
MAQATAETRMLDGIEVPAPGRWVFDKEHTRIGFVGRHLMVTKVRGYFHEFDGSITVGDRLEDSSAEATIVTSTVDTGLEMRDKHLRSADFFEIDKYSTMSFKSTSVERTGPSTLALTGDLTVRDVTHPLTLDVEFEGMARDLMGRIRAVFSASAEIVRDDWGLTWNQAIETGGLFVGPKVKIEIDLEAVPEGQE